MTRQKNELLIGAHMSISEGIEKALYRGKDIGANIIQIFTSGHRSWKYKKFTKDEIRLFEKAKTETKISHIMSHASYLINLGSPKKDILKKSRKALQEEIFRSEQLNLSYLNFHPGAAITYNEEECLNVIVDSLLSMKCNGKTILLMETTSGQGTSVGHKFEHLSYIIRQVDGKIPIGITIDTCHIFAAGYDIKTKNGWEIVLKQFDEVVGLKYLKAFHVNDCEEELGLKKDRHAPIGKGKIGLESFAFIMRDKRVKYLPKYLETPFGEENWAKEIKLLKHLATT
jgi:deoxyribonuclease IV